MGSAHDDGREFREAEPALANAGRSRFYADLEAPWAGFEEQALIEFEIEQCLLTLTEARDAFPKGHTIWKAPPAGVGAR